MARTLDSGFQTEIEADQLRPVRFFKAEFDSGDLNFWTGNREITFNSESYLGSGDLIAIEKIEETDQLIANKVSIKVNGIPSSLVSLALSEPYQGRPVTIWDGALSSDGSTIAGSVQIFKGFMDVMTITDTGEISVINIDAESELITLRNSKERKYTPEDQKAFFPNDKGLDFVPLIQDKELTFGQGRTD